MTVQARPSEPNDAMPMMPLEEAAKATGGVLHGEAGGRVFTHCDIDSRRVAAGGLFFAIRGDRQDGHRFIDAARAQGAVAAVVDSVPDKASLPVIEVPDTTRALGKLAQQWRSRFGIPVVGVTGSNGKTTVCRMLAAIFDVSMPGVAPMGSFNNHWGVPLTLLKISARSQSAVIEMGMNHPGELRLLTHIVQPDVAVITNAAAAHLQGLESVEGVAHAKAEIIEGVKSDGTVVLNADDAYFALWRACAGDRRVLAFGVPREGVTDGYAVWASEIQLGVETRFQLNTHKGSVGISLPLLGAHNVKNALAAAAAAIAAGVALADIQKGLASVEAVSGRLNSSVGAHGARIIDDSYNANPASMRAGLEVLAAQPGRRIAVLGMMGELGAHSARWHQEIGMLARSLGVDALFGLGEEAEAYQAGFGNEARLFDEVDSLVNDLLTELGPDCVVLVKGSRSARMERVVEQLAVQDAKNLSEGVSSC